MPSLQDTSNSGFVFDAAYCGGIFTEAVKIDPVHRVADFGWTIPLMVVSPSADDDIAAGRVQFFDSANEMLDSLHRQRK